MFVPLYDGGKLEQVHLKIDSKGRLCIPPEIREEIGDTAILKKTSEGYLLIPGEPTDFLEEFRKIITSKPRRTGKPENWSPAKMKAIWSKTEE
jgi:bifunctional DNA-binding transcriptional regulator/antitoxin component of YhaV-PrlF toxin-antitoxin module